MMAYVVMNSLSYKRKFRLFLFSTNRSLELRSYQVSILHYTVMNADLKHRISFTDHVMDKILTVLTTKKMQEMESALDSFSSVYKTIKVEQRTVHVCLILTNQ